MEHYKEKSRRFYNRLYVAAAMLAFATLSGVIGYMLIEGYTWVEAFYMTVITLSTVGFSEVRPLSASGEIFTAFLIIFNIGIFTYAIATFSSFLLEGGFREMLERRRMEKKIAKLKDHIIVCGYGRYGQAVARHLIRHHRKFVIIDENEMVRDQIPEARELLFLQGDATSDEMLEFAGVHHAKSLIAALPHDSDNVFVTLSARQLNPGISLISRANDPGSEVKLKRAGANHVVLTNQIGGFFMAALVTKPDTVEFFTALTEKGEDMPNFEEVVFDRLSGQIKGKTIRELEIRQRTGANVVGLKKPDGEFIINPSPDSPIEEHCGIIVLGSTGEIERFKKYMNELNAVRTT